MCDFTFWDTIVYAIVSGVFTAVVGLHLPQPSYASIIQSMVIRRFKARFLSQKKGPS
jgi:hypothetical protein